MEKNKLIEVAVSAPLEKSFYYTVPEDLAPSAFLGMKVMVPFGRRTVEGYIIGFPDRDALAEDTALKLKDIKDIPDPEPAFTPGMLEFYRWIADYYISPLGEVIKTALPASKGKVKRERVVVISETAGGDVSLTPKEERILSFIMKNGRASMRDIAAEFGSPYEIIKRLSKKGQISVIEEEVSRVACKHRGGTWGQIFISDIYSQSA